MNIGAVSSQIQNIAQAVSGVSQNGALQSMGNTTGADGTLMFKDVYNNMISNVNETDSTFEGDIIKAAAGELDNPHQLLIDSQKANIALQLTISARNKALEAYNDIVRMQV